MPSDTAGARLRATVALPLAVFFAVTVEMAPAGALTHIAGSLNTDIGSAAAGSSLYALSTAILALPLSGLALRFDPRKATVLVGAIFTVLGLATAAAPDLPSYLFLRALNGVAHGAFFPLVLALAAAAASQNTGKAVARVLLGNGFALAAGVPVSEALATLNWRIPIAVAAAGVFFSILFAPRPVPSELEGNNDEAHTPARGVYGLAAVFALALAGHFSWYTFLAPAAAADTVPAPLALASYGAAVIIATVFSGTIAGWHRLRRATFVVAAEAINLAAAAFIPGPATTITASVLAGTCFGLLPTLVQTEMLERAASHRPLASGAAVVAFNTGIATGAAAGATTTGLSIHAPALLGAVLLLLAAAGFHAVHSPGGKRRGSRSVVGAKPEPVTITVPRTDRPRV
ncbi:MULTISPECIES: MFS transporter [Arthrobacter]|uniref:MFS transporter n=1 Tax=Arthrobacter terricola TaxID=2547396 RepID=A0A4R5K5J1_9MICC|nr:MULTISPECIES: MFS transporter [Arthrobacter]MBT8163743.1 MFS transporter [Arthrobacter sp. GN70]TDF87194.1 MFS transporter [Arthrobacter terricola]